LNILVTGIGGDIGNAIGRILDKSDICDVVYGCDIHNQHGGRYVFKKCFLVPRVDRKNYIDCIYDLVKEYNIQIVIPSSEPEQRYLLNNGIVDQIGSARLLLPNIYAMEIGFDKLKTARFLEKNNLPFPWTCEVGKQNPESVPCILKSRSGAGSKDIKLVNKYSEIDLYEKLYSDCIWQEKVGSESEEYTCGVYRSSNGETRVLILRRRLSAGITSYAELVDIKQITELCEDIARLINLVGSINIQLRLNGDIPVVFEINPRFSSTVMFRHMAGFQDLIWSIHEMMFQKLPEYKLKYNSGMCLYKKCEEVVML
jgi:carbamoyl-phosphate synthase large subunit